MGRKRRRQRPALACRYEHPVPAVPFRRYLPAFSIAAQLAPGQSVSYTWNEIITPNITQFVTYDYPIIGSTTAAGPGTAGMMFACGGMLIVFGRLRLWKRW